MSKFLLKILIILALTSFCQANYYIQAGKKFNINPKLLWTIAYKESRLNPKAISKINKNGTYDIGIMQINSVHLPRLYRQYRINALDLLNPKINIFVGAEILKMCFNKHGLNENALTCYNGRIKNNPYGKEVLALLKEAILTKGNMKNFKKATHHNKNLSLLKFPFFKKLAKHNFSLFMRFNQGIESLKELKLETLSKEIIVYAFKRNKFSFSI